MNRRTGEVFRNANVVAYMPYLSFLVDASINGEFLTERTPIRYVHLHMNKSATKTYVSLSELNLRQVQGALQGI